MTIYPILKPMSGRSRMKTSPKDAGLTQCTRTSQLSESCIYTGGFLPILVAFRISAPTCSGGDNLVLASAGNKPELHHISTYRLCALKVVNGAEMLFASCSCSHSEFQGDSPASWSGPEPAGSTDTPESAKSYHG